MKSKNKKMVIGIFLLFLILFNSNPYIFNTYTPNTKNESLMEIAAWNLTGTPILIDGNIEWATAASTQPWCSGSGTWGDPYILENVIIDGLSSSTCIEIRNSDVFFKIKNCTVYNSSASGAGIKLDNVENGAIIENNCSFNNNFGIYLVDGDNTTIYYNEVSNNINYQIYIDTSSFYNTIYYNSFIGSPPLAYNNGLNNNWDNGTIGNYWSDYDGIDIDDNGIGDTPYTKIIGGGIDDDDYPIWDDGTNINNDPFTLNYGINSDPYSIDPVESWDTITWDVVSQVCETLFMSNLTDPSKDVVPNLATAKGTWSKDNLNYTVPLRTDVIFHDGTPFNASCVKWTFDRISYFINATGTLPGNTSEAFPSTVFYLESGSPIINKTIVKSEYSLEFVLNEPFAPLDSLLSFVPCGILSPSSTPKYRYINKTAESLIGTGPFTFEEYIFDYIIKFKGNEKYWGGFPHLKFLNFMIVDDFQQRLDLLELGVLDFIRSVSSYERDTVETYPKIRIIGPEPTGVFWYLGMNNKLLNATWRKAISYAFNYTYVIEDMYQGSYDRARSPIPDGVLYSNSTNNCAIFNISHARSIMQSMDFGVGWNISYPGTDDALWEASIFTSDEFGAPLDVNFHEGSFTDQQIMDMLRDNLNKIGIDTVETVRNWGDFFDTGTNYPNQLGIWRFGWSPDYNDPHLFINFLYSNTSSGGNYEQVNDTYLQNLMDQGINKTTDSVRRQIYNEIQRYVVEELYPQVFLMQGTTYYALREDFVGFKHNTFGGIYFNQIYSTNIDPFEINGTASGVGAHNWTWVSEQPWSEGSGTAEDPYIFEEITINGQNSSTCIEIANSDKYFIIRNSKFYNGSNYIETAGIKLIM